MVVQRWLEKKVVAGGVNTVIGDGVAGNLRLPPGSSCASFRSLSGRVDNLVSNLRFLVITIGL